MNEQKCFLQLRFPWSPGFSTVNHLYANHFIVVNKNVYLFSTKMKVEIIFWSELLQIYSENSKFFREFFLMNNVSKSKIYSKCGLARTSNIFKPLNKSFYGVIEDSFKCAVKLNSICRFLFTIWKMFQRKCIGVFVYKSH